MSDHREVLWHVRKRLHTQTETFGEPAAVRLASPEWRDGWSAALSLVSRTLDSVERDLDQSAKVNEQ